MSAKKPKSQSVCACGAPLKTKEELAFEMCHACLNQTGVSTSESKVPVPEQSVFSIPKWTNVQAFDRLLWLIDWWAISAEQCSPEDLEYVAKRLEELAQKMRRSI
jgi:hypothetical protein